MKSATISQKNKTVQSDIEHKPKSHRSIKRHEKDLHKEAQTSSSQITRNHSNSITHWVGMSRKNLDALYKNASPGDMPQGDTFGTAILAGGPLPQLFARIAKVFAWQGKVFDLFAPEFNSGVVVNKVSPLGIKLIVAKIYRGKSWMDGKSTIIIDYGSTSLFAGQIRDEIREIEPGLYLGKVWWGKTRILDFALETHSAIAA